MDYTDYKKWLKPGRGEKLANRCIEVAQKYEVFLQTIRDGVSIEDATIEDFEAFAATFSRSGRRCPYRYLQNLYRYLSDKEMTEAIQKLDAQNPVPVPIKTFHNIKPEHQRKLSANGIVTNIDLLFSSKTLC